MAAALTPVFPYLLAALAAALVLWRAARLARRRSGEPPLEAGWLPWLGVGRRFGTDALGLLNECRARHGPCFTLLVAGTRMTFLTSPDDYAALFRNQALSFQRITRRFSINSFGVSPETMDSVDDKKIGRFLQESVARCTHALAPQTACMPLTHPRGRALCAAHLLGKGVEPLRDRALQLLQHTLVQQHQAANGAPQQVDLWDVVQRIVFFASADAIFGPSMATESAFENFRTFDRYMPLLFTGFPAGLIPSLRRALAVLGNMLSLNSLKSAPGRISDFIRLRSEYLESVRVVGRARGLSQSLSSASPPPFSLASCRSASRATSRWSTSRSCGPRRATPSPPRSGPSRTRPASPTSWRASARRSSTPSARATLPLIRCALRTRARLCAIAAHCVCAGDRHAVL
jgi:hypothetical protein